MSILPIVVWASFSGLILASFSSGFVESCLTMTAMACCFSFTLSIRNSSPLEVDACVGVVAFVCNAVVEQSFVPKLCYLPLGKRVFAFGCAVEVDAVFLGVVSVDLKRRGTVRYSCTRQW